MNNKITIGGVVLALILGIWALATPNKTYIQQNGNEPVQIKGTASSAVDTKWFSVGGVKMWTGHTDSLKTATTTVCALQSPTATSTLVGGGVMFSVSSTTASTVTLAMASTPYATSTQIGTNFSIAAGGQASISASTTVIFPPNYYLVVGMQGNIGTFSPTGQCNALWMNLN